MAKKSVTAELKPEVIPEYAEFEVITDRRPAWDGRRLEKGERFRASGSDPGLAIMLEHGFVREVAGDAGTS